MKRIRINTIRLILLLAGALVLWLLIRPPEQVEVPETQEAPSGKFEIGGQFPGGCLPLTLPTQEEVAMEYPDQKISGALDEYFNLVEGYADREVAEIENGAFCLVELDGKVFGFLNQNYVGPNGESATRIFELWSQSRQIPQEDICRIIWFEGNDPCQLEDPLEGDGTFVLPISDLCRL